MNSSFQIYNAAAGSGKTFTLVKEVLKILIENSNPNYFDTILAITFTNKASNEMKSRLLEWLTEMSKNKDSNILNLLEKELNIEKKLIQERSKKILSKILHNYSRFSISTIDKFSLKLTKSFAKDLGIAANVNIELDAKKLLTETIDALFYELEKDSLLTKILVDISLQKLDNDKSWQLDFDFQTVFGELLFDQHKTYLDELNKNSLSELNYFRQNTLKDLRELKTEMILAAKNALDILKSNGLEFEYFHYKDLPNYFQKTQKGKFEFPSNRLEKALSEEKYISKKADKIAASKIQQIIPVVIQFYNQIKHSLTNYVLKQKVNETASILSLINEINRKFSEIKSEQQIMLLSDSNKLISRHIKEQPAAFIYERVGNRYNHLFIDEFQDTSDLQWNNLSPLIENARATEDTIMLVGDVKQSIYRWRGGNPKLMLNLAKEPDVKLEKLPKNWRSFKTIIEFNNELYSLAGGLLKNEDHKKLYYNSAQHTNDLAGGYVQLNFFEDTRKSEVTYLENTHLQILENIKIAEDNGFELNEIVILCRSKLDGKRIAEFIVEQEIPVLSSESLLLNNNIHIQAIIALFNLIDFNFEKQSIVHFLFKLKQLDLIAPDNFTLFTQGILENGKESLIKKLNEFDLDFNFLNHSYFSLYDLSEIIIRALKLNIGSNIYIQSFLDIVLEFSNKHSSDISLFLEYWMHKKEKAGIRSPENVNAIKILTIHQSKGLEFPVVIIPFADWSSKDSGMWIPLGNKKIPNFYVSGTKNLEYVNQSIQNRVEEEKELRILDEINLLYVATTRAQEQLYIITKKASKPTNNFLLNLFECYLLNQSNKNNNQFILGNPKRISKPNKLHQSTEEIQLISTPWTDKIKINTASAFRWEEIDSDRNYGNLIHHLLAEIYIETDITKVLKKAILKGIINEEEKQKIQIILIKIVKHKQLKKYFTNEYHTLNERDFIVQTDNVIRPDRLAINHNEVIILDYKTGKQQQAHYHQIKAYANYFKTLNEKKVYSFLVYIQEEIEVIKVQ